MRKSINYLLVCFFFGQLISCTVVIPNYTTVDNLSRLNPGMNKQQALVTLDNLYPHDILNGESEICEIHVYKYKHPKQETRYNIEDRIALRGGKEKFDTEGEAYIIYKNGVIYSVLTEAGEKDFAGVIASIYQAGTTCVEIKGCTDPTSINYNEFATIDDGSCQYCDCGYVPNPNYKADRPKSDCNVPCVKMETLRDGNECTTCDLIDAVKEGKGSVNINVDMDDLSNKKKKPNTKSNKEDNNKNTDNKGNSDNKKNDDKKNVIKVY